MRNRWLMIVPALLLAACGYKPAPEVGETKKTMATVAKYLNDYKKDFGKYPPSLQDLMNKPPTSAPEAKKWKGPYMKEMLRDAWGNDFVYRCPGKNGIPFDLISYGADGKEGGTKDDQDIAQDKRSLIPDKK